MRQKSVGTYGGGTARALAARCRAVFFFAALLPAACGPVRPDVELIRGDGPDRFVVSGLSPNEIDRKPIAVFVDSGSSVPLFGKRRVESGTVVFEPRFPLESGVTYRAVLELDGRRIEKRFPIPSRPPAPPTELLRVFPSGDVLPENLLKFYLHFSAPMSRGEVYERVRLLDSAGKPVDYPFLRLHEELWDGSGTRITVFFDPGRIKRGLKPRQDVGPVLEEGKSYALVVDRAWKDAEGRPLKAGFRKAFRSAAPDDRQPDPARWKIDAPGSGSTDPLTVRFGEPLDEAMLNGVLVVHDPAGKAVGGRIVIDQGETRWRFLPDRAWGRGEHALFVDTTLEDRAGNSIGQPFEVDIFKKVDRRIPAKTVRLPFTVR